MIKLYPFRRIAKPAEIAKTICFLVSDDASLLQEFSCLFYGGRNIR
jgi:NAD(P)-dependent dehydrogenase (short-subunit alcohol dehydrogenase family)